MSLRLNISKLAKINFTLNRSKLRSYDVHLFLSVFGGWWTCNALWND